MNPHQLNFSFWSQLMQLRQMKTALWCRTKVNKTTVNTPSPQTFLAKTLTKSGQRACCIVYHVLSCMTKSVHHLVRSERDETLFHLLSFLFKVRVPLLTRMNEVSLVWKTKVPDLPAGVGTMNARSILLSLFVFFHSHEKKNAIIKQDTTGQEQKLYSS